MNIREIARILDARWICCEEDADGIVRYAFASDMMSDVLAHVGMDTMLLTGLINSQSVRTAEMLDVPCMVFVRGNGAARRADRPAADGDELLHVRGLRPPVRRRSGAQPAGRAERRRRR